MIAYDEIKTEFANNKCLSTVWSTETISIALTNPVRELIIGDFTIWPPFG